MTGERVTGEGVATKKRVATKERDEEGAGAMKGSIR